MVDEETLPPTQPQPQHKRLASSSEGADEGGSDMELDRSLRRLEAFLVVVGFPCSATAPFLALSASVFALFGVALPAAAVEVARCPLDSSRCEHYEVPAFESCLLVSEAVAAGVSLVFTARNLYKYGVRRFLFVDQHRGHVNRFQKEYLARFQSFYRVILWWMVPCFIARIARELYRLFYTTQKSAWRSLFVFFASTISWTYLNTIILSSCMLFNLVCNLQAVHFNDFSKLLQQDDRDPLEYLQEHVRLLYYLSKISHRFRLFLVLVFFCITANLCVYLFQTTGYSGNVNFVNGGHIAVSTVVEVVSVVLCLHAAAKISHLSQGIASVASRWHAGVTCSSDFSHITVSCSSNDLPSITENLLSMEYLESDLESSEASVRHANGQLVSYMSSYNKRQALLFYLLSNPGGITIFGWTVDRTLLTTILMLELTLVLFVLGTTFVVPLKELKSILTDHPWEQMQHLICGT